MSERIETSIYYKWGEGVKGKIEVDEGGERRAMLDEIEKRGLHGEVVG